MSKIFNREWLKEHISESRFANGISPRLINHLALNSKAKQEWAENENNCRRCKTNRDKGTISNLKFSIRLEHGLQIADEKSGLHARGQIVDTGTKRSDVGAIGSSREDISNVGKDIEVFIILILAPLPLAQGFFRFDEFDALNPLDHFIA